MGGRVVLHGHGRRGRQLRGPLAPGERPAIVVLQLRRYLCIVCGETCTVGPREVLTGRLYAASAIAWALALFGALRRTAAEVRERVSAWAVVGADAAGRWPTLLRWARAVRERRLFRCVRPAPPSWPLRRVAERAATTVGAYAPPSPEPQLIDALAFIGAAHAR